ncbi:MAG: hypothetical protein OET46_12720, partial [Xanthomonadales bacterium]|nr:hypothetical protein [Xanthomonadales bacterium]
AGQLVEKMSVSQFGLTRLQAAFQEGTRVYLRGAEKVVQTTPDLIEGQVLDPAAVLELDEKDWQAARSPAEAITWERFLLDLHAARFLGPAARLFNDLMAAFILILAMSGLWMYLVNRKKS